MVEKISNGNNNEDKFILMGLDEAGDLGEILKNKTAKKILNFLGDVKEASEKDMADGLDAPINTIEYNLKKLVKARLVEKTKNFFWSVKGKKIPMYKLAKKHIIIGTKKPSLSYIKNLLPVIIGGFFGVFSRFLILRGSFTENIVRSENSLDSSMKGLETLTQTGELNRPFEWLVNTPYWVWFLAFALITFLVILIIKKLKGGSKI
jgi:DNA-binding transcriptional ArsR family regulator